MKISGILALSLTGILHAEVLYETDFEAFSVGINQWSGTEGWISNDNTSGAQSIDGDLIPALQNTASLGFNQPAGDLTFVAKPINYDHVTAGAPIVKIDTLLGIEDSTNGRRDDFFLSVYNSAGNRLASIRFDNEDPTVDGTLFGFWRDDGLLQHDTILDFIHGELFNLFITIDLENNLWSADIDGNPLFENAQFTATNNPVNLGLVSFEWDVDAPTPNQHGNNFLLVADLAITNSAVTTPPINVSYTVNESDHITLSWQTAVGFDDQVQHSSDLITWQDTLPNSSFTGVSSAIAVYFTDESPDRGPTRFYRIRRSPAP